MVDFVKANISPSDILEIVKWRQKRDYSGIWCIKKKYRTKKSREMVDFVASQYAQVRKNKRNFWLLEKIIKNTQNNRNLTQSDS